MSDDELIDLLPDANGPNRGRGDDPRNKRSSFASSLILATALIFLIIVFFMMKDRIGGKQIIAVLLYTYAVLLSATDRFSKPFPWDVDRYRTKFLVLHTIALAIVYGGITFAFAMKSHMPDWFVHEGRKGSILELCLILLGTALALAEIKLMSDGDDGSESDGEKSDQS
jgi:hypothetical protein